MPIRYVNINDIQLISVFVIIELKWFILMANILTNIDFLCCNFFINPFALKM